MSECVCVSLCQHDQNRLCPSHVLRARAYAIFCAHARYGLYDKLDELLPLLPADQVQRMVVPSAL